MCLYNRCDALSKKTLDIITAQGNDAIIQIKGNQERLLKIIKDLVTQKLKPMSTFSQQQGKKRNRTEYREISVFQLPLNSLPWGWENTFKTIIRVRRYTDCFDSKRKEWILRTEVSHYGSTFLVEAQRAADCIRSHWHIENKNHYVRDVSLGEDASRIRKNPGIFARLRSFALNLFRINNVTNIKEALFKNALCFDNLLNYQGVF